MPPAGWVAQAARTLGWTMNEVRAHTMRDIRAMMRIMEREQQERERAERKRKAHAASRAMSR
jgi:hypothetical protein